MLDAIEMQDNSFAFKIPKSLVDYMFEIQAKVPCQIIDTSNDSIIGVFSLPLNSLGYRITQYDEMTDDSSLVKISISIDRNITFNGKSCYIILYSLPTIVISYIE